MLFALRRLRPDFEVDFCYRSTGYYNHIHTQKRTLTIADETSEGNGPFVDNAGAVVLGVFLNEFVLDRLREPLLLLSRAESAEEEVDFACVDIVTGTDLWMLSFHRHRHGARGSRLYTCFNY